MVVLAILAVVGVVMYVQRSPSDGAKPDVHSSVGRDILVMRTPGGLLEVSTVRATELFDTKYVYSLLGMKVGETAPHIRVPAMYRYHVELAPEWVIRRSGETFSVIAPAVKPSLPVAVDLAQMQKDVGGTWYLIPFGDAEDLDALEKRITAKLEEKARSSVYVNMQRDAARKTVREFVEKWLITQQEWKVAQRPTIVVIFSDEAPR